MSAILDDLAGIVDDHPELRRLGELPAVATPDERSKPGPVSQPHDIFGGVILFSTTSERPP